MVLMVQSSLLLAISAMMTASGRRNSPLAHVCVVMPLPPATVSSVLTVGRMVLLKEMLIIMSSRMNNFCVQISSY